jgi:hypothetical protein
VGIFKNRTLLKTIEGTSAEYKNISLYAEIYLSAAEKPFFSCEKGLFFLSIEVMCLMLQLSGDGGSGLSLEERKV